MAKKDKLYKVYGVLTAVAMELVILVVISLYLGKWLDKKFQLMGLATPMLIFAAMGLWVFILIKALSKIEKEEKEDEQNQTQ
ncbi:MAG: AtpZ/AtpI family protein [Bdellovibrionaceae bacterium]|nr:AtpZ/AtpI family protein [Pseudobdellovibrionaceae bacterium]